MRKKIPTITRPDPAYAASLRQDGGEIPERKEAGSAPSGSQPAAEAATERVEQLFVQGTVQALDVFGQQSDATPTPAEPPTVARTSRDTRKIDIRVNALARQESALLACGVDPSHVIRAALRRAVKGWQLSPAYVPPCQDRRTRSRSWQARTSLAVDAAHLQVLLRDHDPLDVCSKWALIRGQVEPRVWAEIDAVLAEIAASAATPQDDSTTEDIDQV